MANKTYEIITNAPYDKGASVTYWIKESRKVFFNLFTRVKCIGDYRIDDSYGELGEMPFFLFKSR